MDLCLSCQSFDIQAFSRDQNPWLTTEWATVEAGKRSECAFCSFVYDTFSMYRFAGPSHAFRPRKRWLHWSSSRIPRRAQERPTESHRTSGLGIGMLLLTLSSDPEPSLGLKSSSFSFFLHAEQGKISWNQIYKRSLD